MDADTIISPISYMEKPRNREIKELAHGYTASKPRFKTT